MSPGEKYQVRPFDLAIALVLMEEKPQTFSNLDHAMWYVTRDMPKEKFYGITESMAESDELIFSIGDDPMEEHTFSIADYKGKFYCMSDGCHITIYNKENQELFKIISQAKNKEAPESIIAYRLDEGSPKELGKWIEGTDNVEFCDPLCLFTEAAYERTTKAIDQILEEDEIILEDEKLSRDRGIDDE